MTEESQFVLDSAIEGMSSAVTHLEREFHKIRTGKASPAMLEDVKIDYYGVMTPLSQAANINTPDARQIVVQPFDRSTLSAMEKAIMAANLGFNPRNDGEVLRIQVPPLTEERRRNLVKQAKAEAENSKVVIRGLRRNANDEAKVLKKDGTPEDEIKRLEDEIQKLTDKYIKQIDDMSDQKEKEMMAV
jgi:ribosome recycling factor